MDYELANLYKNALPANKGRLKSLIMNMTNLKLSANITEIDQYGRVTVKFNYDMLAPPNLECLWINKSLSIEIKFAFDSSYDDK